MLWLIQRNAWPIKLSDAALRVGAQSDHLAQLYPQRAFKLLEEDYAAIPLI